MTGAKTPGSAGRNGLLRRRLPVALLMAAVIVVTPGHLASAGATPGGGVDAQAYVSDTYPVDPYAGQPPALHVAAAGGRSLVHSLLQLSYPPDTTSLGVILVPTAGATGSINATGASMVACPITAPWRDPVNRAHPPPYSCAALTVAATHQPTDEWSVDLTQFLGYWMTHPNNGLALRAAQPSTAEAWSLSFDPGRDHLTIPPAPGSSTGSGPPGQGVVGSLGFGSTGASTSPAAPSQLSGSPTGFGFPPPALAPPSPTGVASTSQTPANLRAGSPSHSGHAGQRSSHTWLRWLIWGLLFALALGLRTPVAGRIWRRLSVRIDTARRLPTAMLRSTSSRLRRAIIVTTGLLGASAAWAVFARLLPQGLPVGIVLLGVILGSLTGLTAIGLVLIFRVVRAINLAQAEIGGLSAATALILVTGNHIPYLVAVPCGLLAAVVAGVVIEAVMHRFRNAPRLIVTVATIGIAQILAGLETELPNLVSHLSPASTFTTPFHFRFRVHPVTLTGDSLVTLVTVPIVAAALVWVVSRTDTGRALRAVADSDERALLVGIPIRRVMRIAWVLAAVLSGVGALLSSPIVGPTPGVAAGPTALLAPLAAAVIGGMENLPVTFVAALAIGVIQQGIYWSYPGFTSLDGAVLFAAIAVGLSVVRLAASRTRDQGLGHYAAVREIRPVDRELIRRAKVRLTRTATWGLLVSAVLVAPLALSTSNVIIMSYMAIFGLIAVSLVVLTGWAGQVSLGQFAFVGVGAAIAAVAISRHNVDVFAALAAAGLIASLCAVVVGIPVLRLSGQFAAVATLAFAVPVATILLNPTHFPNLNPLSMSRPVVLHRFPLNNAPSFYYFCVGVLALGYWVARNLRASRVGRALLAVRDNELVAAGWGIAGNRLKITAYAVAGAMAGIAGGLYVVGLRGMPYQGFSPEASLQVFTMVVIGGLGSLQGAIAGAIYVVAVQSLLRGAAQLLATGAGLLVLLLIVPEGLGGLLFRVRDWWYTQLSADPARRSAGDEELSPETPPTNGHVPRERANEAPSHRPIMSWSDIDAGYDKLQVLFQATGSITGGEALALLGTNGAGKSTLLRVLSGIIRPRRGRISFDGIDITNLSPQDRLALGIVTIQGGHGIFPSLTVEDNLRLMGWTVRRDPLSLAAAIRRSYETFPRLAERRTERAGQLSGGEQQMLAIAQAFICPTRLLLVDELTLGLSPAAITTLLSAVGQLVAEGTTAVLVEQSLNTAASIADRCVFMERGRTRYTGSIHGLMTRPDLARAVFLDEAARSAVIAPRHAPKDAPTGGLALRATALSKHFGGTAALNSLSLDVPAGQITGLIGPNGAGKTTVLDVCSGFVAPDSGNVFFAGADITTLPAHDRAALGLGRVFQDARLVPSLTVREVLATALECHLQVREPLACLLRVSAARASDHKALRQADELVDQFGLGRYANNFIFELSTGTRRIVELACTAGHQPTVLLLDEPSAGVAQRETEALAEMLNRIRTSLGLTMLIVEHDLNFIHCLADRLVCLDLGRQLASGSPEAVLNDPAVLQAYFGIDGSRQAPPSTRPGEQNRPLVVVGRTGDSAAATSRDGAPGRAAHHTSTLGYHEQQPGTHNRGN